MSRGFPGGSDNKESTCNAGDLSLIPGSGRSPGEGNGYPLQYSCLENSIDREAWWATFHEVAKSRIELSIHFLFSVWSIIYILSKSTWTFICTLVLCHTNLQAGLKSGTNGKFKDI